MNSSGFRFYTRGLILLNKKKIPSYLNTLAQNILAKYINNDLSMTNLY